jgi:hypothetical protein
MFSASQEKSEMVIDLSKKGIVRRKVKKTRCFKDKKGYMVNEDYSSFEEMDAEEFAKTQ